MGAEHESLSELYLFTGEEIVHKGPCILHCFLLAADGGAAEADIYDGENANAERRIHLEALSGTTFGWRSTDGIKFYNGIFVATTATNGVVMVEYHPVILDTKPRVIKEPSLS